MFADIDFFYFSSFVFKENHVLIEEENPSEENPSEKIVIVKKELDGIDIDDIVEILKYLLMMENLSEISTKSLAFYKLTCSR